MRSTIQRSPDIPDGLISMLLGFFGVTAAFLFLPKTIKYVVRRFVLGTVAEIVAVIITGLLTEKLVDLISHEKSDLQ